MRPAISARSSSWTGNDPRRPPPRRLPAAHVAPGAGRTWSTRPRYPVVDAHNHLGAAVRRRLGGPVRRPSWSPPSTRPVSRRSSTSTAARARRSPRRSTDGRSPVRTASSSSPGSTTTAGRPSRRSARPRRRGCGTRVARGARGLKVWKTARAARARSGRPAGRRRRRAARPAVGDRRRARAAGRHPHRRPGRVLRAARRDERALGGAARAPGLALLADAARRRPRRARVPAVRRAAGGVRAARRGAIRGRRSSAPTSAAPPRTSRCVGRLLDEHPNLNVDIAARLGELGRQPYTHAGVLPALRGPDPVRHGPGARSGDLRDPLPVPRDLRRVVRLRHGPGPGQGRWQIHGIGLPDDVLRKVYRDNARRILRLGPS